MKRLAVLLAMLCYGGCHRRPDPHATRFPVIEGPIYEDPHGATYRVLYIRDDVHFSCFAFLRGYPQSLTKVNCTDL